MERSKRIKLIFQWLLVMMIGISIGAVLKHSTETMLVIAFFNGVMVAYNLYFLWKGD